MAFKPPMYDPGSSPTFADLLVTGDLTVQGNFEFGDLSSDALNINGTLHLIDDAILSFGNTAAAPDSKLVFDTASTDADMLLWALPTASASTVPVLVFGLANIIGTDWAAFAGSTEPSLVLTNAAADKLFITSFSTDKFKVESTSALELRGVGASLISAGADVTLSTTTSGNIVLSPVLDSTNLVDINSRIDAGFTFTDFVGATMNANNFLADVTYTANTANVHRTFLGTLQTRGTLIDYTNPQTVSIFQYDNYSTGTITLATNLTFNNINQGAGTISEGRGQTISYGNTGGGTYTEFSGLRMTRSAGGTSAGTVYAFNFAHADYISNSRAIKVKNPTPAARYIPLSTADTGITFDSTDLVLATTTSGEVKFDSFGDVKSYSGSGIFRVYGPSDVKNVYLYNDDTDGWVSTSNGSLKLNAFTDIRATSDLYIEGTNGARWGDLTRATFGTGVDFSMLWNTYQASDSMYFGVDATSRTIIIGDLADFDTDFGIPAQNDPTLVIMSNDAAELTRYIKIKYDNAGLALPSAAIYAGDGTNNLALVGGNVTAYCDNFNVRAKGTNTWNSLNIVGFSGSGAYQYLDYNGTGVYNYTIENDNTTWIHFAGAAAGLIAIGGVTVDGSDVVTAGVLQVDYTAGATKVSVAGDFAWTGGTAYTNEIDDGTAGAADTIDWTIGNNHKSTLDVNVTYTFTAPPGPAHITLKMVQDAGGTNTVTWPATVMWDSGTEPTWVTTANAINLAFFYYDGTNYYGSGIVGAAV